MKSGDQVLNCRDGVVGRYDFWLYFTKLEDIVERYLSRLGRIFIQFIATSIFFVGLRNKKLYIFNDFFSYKIYKLKKVKGMEIKLEG